MTRKKHSAVMQSAGEMINVKEVYRNEWKYLLSNQNLSMLKSRLQEVMELDEHTPKEGKYLIHSLYFDDYQNGWIVGFCFLCTSRM